MIDIEDCMLTLNIENQNFHRLGNKNSLLLLTSFIVDCILQLAMGRIETIIDACCSLKFMHLIAFNTHAIGKILLAAYMNDVRYMYI